MSEVDRSAVQEDQKYHHYSSNVIPWYVRFIWLLFWAFIIYYSIRYFMPMIQREMVSPP
jgi:hypothetical protein